MKWSKYIKPYKKYFILGPLCMIVEVLGEIIMPMWYSRIINLGVQRGMVVYGMDKLDEISLSAPTHVCEFRDGWFKSYTIKPEDFGMERCRKSDLLGGSPEQNAEITLGILQGEKGHRRNAVLLNAGAGLYLNGKADSLEAGIRLAGELIDSGRAMATLRRVIEVSNRPEEEA